MAATMAEDETVVVADEATGSGRREVWGGGGSDLRFGI